MKRDFKGIWIPKQVWLSKELTMMEKIFLVEIDSLDNEEGCFASNAYFAEFFGITKGRCTQIIKSLEKKNILTIDLIYKEKLIKKRVLRVVSKLNTPIKNIKQGYLENDDDNNTLYNTSTIYKKLRENKVLFESISMQNKGMDVEAKIKEFETFCNSIQKTHQNDTDMYNHFIAWIRQNKTNRNRDVKKELDYFLLRFNQISNKTYLPTKELEDLLRVQLENGFNSEQMAIATKKMRSSDDRNWHKKTLFLHATPEHLLKESNLNKYLNQNF